MIIIEVVNVSCFIVSDWGINNVIQLITHMKKEKEIFGETATETGVMDEDKLTEFGKRLLRLNIKAYKDRYEGSLDEKDFQEDMEHAKARLKGYKFQYNSVIFAQEIFSLKCLLYQVSDLDMENATKEDKELFEKLTKLEQEALDRFYNNNIEGLNLKWE